MQSHNNKAVAEFLIRNQSRDLVEGLNVLSTMKMPIHDKHSFEAGLEEHSADDKCKKQLIQMFIPQDFPILSTGNAFEKYFAKFQPFPIPFPPIPLPELDLPDFPSRPSACEVYHDGTFSGPHAIIAADCACRVYAQARRRGENLFRATIDGHFAGMLAQSTGRCEI